MNNYDYCEDIKNRFSIDELNSQTLSYRINGFLYACNMNIEKGMYLKLISNFRRSFINKSYNDEELDYSINFARGHDKEYGNSFLLVGKYNDLDILLENFYDEDYNKNKINEIPFRISVSKKCDDYKYTIEMDSEEGSKVQFRLNKKKEGESVSNYIGFHANIKDFSKILNLVKTFTNNPKVVFGTFSRIMNEKIVMFTNDDLNKVIKEDELLAKPAKIRKKFKILTNND